MNLKSYLNRAKAWLTSLPKTHYYLVVGTGVVVVLLVSMGGAAEFTSRPEFCPTCHYMEPYYESWQAAPAHAQVKCTTCHFPPGLAGTIKGKMEGLVQVVNYVTSSYTRRTPWAEIEDASCMQSGCHDTRLEGSVGFQGVTFDHGPHLTGMRRGKELRCTSCHSQIVQGNHMRVTETTCFLCHMKDSDEVEPELYEELSNCQTCHKWDSTTVGIDPQLTSYHVDLKERGFSCNQCHGNTVVGDGFVPPQTCVNCHSEPERLSRITDTELVHRTHIAENKIECVQCHLQIQHKIQRVNRESPLECATCHKSLHDEQVALFTGEVDGLPSHPSPMFVAGLDCAGCHVFHEQAAPGAQTATPESCESCHGAGYDRLLNLWKSGAAENLNEYRRTVRQLESQVRAAGAERREVAAPAVAQAERILSLLEIGKPVHNVGFYDDLLRAGYTELNRAAAAIGRGVVAPRYRTSIAVPGECANCHSGVERITTTYRGRRFSHDVHISGESLSCATCHSNTRRHGEVILSPTACASCHHKAEAERADLTCAGCHEEAAAIYSGTYAQMDVPDLMFDSDVGCEDCHGSGEALIKPAVSVCVDCHDEDYEATGIEWRGEIEGLMAEVKALADQAPAGSEAAAEARTVLADFGLGAARGLHNYELTFELLTRLKGRLQATD